MGHPGACLFWSFAKDGTVGQGDGAVAFGETLSVRAEHERDVGVSGLCQAEQSCQQDLARGRAARSAPLTTSPIPCAASSTTTASW